jgi:DNA polymerase III gamma/tau subunit
MPDDMMGGYRSTRTTLCLLAGVGALCGGVAGAAIVGKLATDGSVPAAVARDEPAAVSRTRAMQVAAVAARSPSRLPTPWSPADAQAARAGGERQRVGHLAAREHVPHRTAVGTARTGTAPAAGRAKTVATAVTQTGVPPAPVTAAPQAVAPARPTRPPARSPAPQRAPEPAPNASRPSPEPAPARTSPKPDPTGAFDDSG